MDGGSIQFEAVVFTGVLVIAAFLLGSISGIWFERFSKIWFGTKKEPDRTSRDNQPRERREVFKVILRLCSSFVRIIGQRVLVNRYPDMLQ